MDWLATVLLCASVVSVGVPAGTFQFETSGFLGKKTDRACF